MKTIKNVCVAGAGAMGMQIALNAAAHGYLVKLYGPRSAALEKAENWIKSYLTKNVEKGKYTTKNSEEILARLIFGTNLEESVSNCDLFIDSSKEDKDIKSKLFTEVNKYAPDDAILASNSSYIGSSEFADCVNTPERLVNLHYFNPAMHMKLVEIVRGKNTSDETVEVLKEFVKSIGKEYITVNREIEGFVVNRLLRAIQNEAFYLYDLGIASFEDIDSGAEKGLNHPMGPFRLLDLTGIDICFYNRNSKYEKTGNPADKPPRFLTEKFNKGEFGRKTGKGWYDYTSK